MNESQLDASKSAAEIVAAAIEAAGGESLGRLTGVRRQGDIHLEGEMFGVLDGKWTTAYVPGKKGFQLADFQQAATATAWDGETGWEESMMGLRDLDPAEVSVNRLLWEPNVLYALEREGQAKELIRSEDEMVEGLAHYVLSLSTGDTDVLKVYVHPESWLISRLTSSAEMPQAGTLSVLMKFDGYERFGQEELGGPGGAGGVMLPQVSFQSFENLFDIEKTYTSTEINPVLKDSLFAKPGS